jgi:hypothetical protein
MTASVLFRVSGSLSLDIGGGSIYVANFHFGGKIRKLDIGNSIAYRPPTLSTKQICDRTGPDPHGVRSRADEKRAKDCRTRVLGSNGTRNWRQPKITARTYVHFCKKHVNAVKWTPKPSQKSPARVRTDAEIFVRPWFLIH